MLLGYSGWGGTGQTLAMRGEVNVFTQKGDVVTVSPVGINDGIEASDGGDTIMASEFI
jgi:hypothetical protein